MRFGVMLLQVEGWPEVAHWAEQAEAQGWEDIWVADSSGLDEFLLYWPFEPEGRGAREAVIERVASEVLHRLRDNLG